MEPERPRRSWVTEGVIIALITVAGIPVVTVTASLCTLRYHVGFCEYFGRRSA